MSSNVNNQYDFFKLVNLDADGNLGVNVISGGGGSGATQNLNSVLTVGNTTGGQDIVLSTVNDRIQDPTATSQFYVDGSSLTWEIVGNNNMRLSNTRLETQKDFRAANISSSGFTKTLTFQVEDNAAEGRLLHSDSLGNATWRDLYTFGQTQWSATNPSPVTVNNGTSINGFGFFTEADKVSGGTTSYDEYTIITGGSVTATAQLGHIVVPYTGTPYEGQRLYHNIRVNFGIATGTIQNLALELRRAGDDSVIGSPIPLVRNQDEPGIQEVFLTYTAGATDPFVTGGFYIALRNDSGGNVNIDTGNIGVLIITSYQQPTYFP